jgi:nickel-dependent lactate racemase
MGMMFRILHGVMAKEGARLDVLIALGTHPPMTEEAINARLELTPDERSHTYADTRFLNHRWDDPAQLVSIGSLSEDEVDAISGGLMREVVDVTINKLVFDYDLLLIVGPTFPHEVAGFSGGNKYLFPGISGKEIIDMFHWLGALITNPQIIGRKHTRVRDVVDRAASLVPVERKCVSLVVEGGSLVGLYVGAPEEAWSASADLSNEIHVLYEERPFESVLSCAPPMYDDLWVGGKCAYKLEPVVADGGELIIYAPHISRISIVHGEDIRSIGYHVRDYFVKQPGRFAGVPRGVMAHSTHVKGVGAYEGGVERPRIRVTLATRISKTECEAVNLGYRDYRAIDVDRWKGKTEVGLLHVPKAGETLYRLYEGASRTTPSQGALFSRETSRGQA